MPATVGVATAVVFTTGFALALTGGFGEVLAPIPPGDEVATKSNALRVVALGDSISVGIGDSRGGYVNRLASALRTGGREISINNLAVNGDETDDVLAVIKGAEARRQLAAADLILVSAGGNDLSHGLRSMTGDGTFPPVEVRDRARENLRRLLTELRAINANATIRLLGLYNPFDVVETEAAEARAHLLEWNNAVERAAVTFPGVLVVPIADLFAGRPGLLAGDRFHPGPRGHQLIAERLLASLPYEVEEDRDRRR